jgi:hypothetical protein
MGSASTLKNALTMRRLAFFLDVLRLATVADAAARDSPW